MSNPCFPNPLNLKSSDLNCLVNDTEERKWKGPFTFIQGADTQFGMIDGYLLKSPIPDWKKDIRLAKESIRRINEMNPKPRFYVICGDMIDAFPTSPDTEKIREQQYADFVKVFSELDPEVKLVCVCGNHDIGNIPTSHSLSVYRKQFGSDVFSFWVGGVKFVVLNSQYFEAPTALPQQTAMQMEFLNTIADPSAKHIVVFQHIPFFLNDPNEPKEYFNIEQNERIKLLEILRNSGVRYVFCGHYHRNAGAMYKDIEEVVTAAVGAPMGKDPSGFRIVQVSEDKISHQYVTFCDMETLQKIIHGIDDPSTVLPHEK